MQFERLGPYAIGKVLGKGGMGMVYEGIADESGQRVAVKILPPQLAMTEGFRERFEAEIDSLKKLRHENIVRLFGYGEQEGFLFYSMELVDGTSLEEELRRGRRYDWREVAQIAIQVCKALKHAHDHGVIHRDIKPANLLCDADGNVKLSDFGIARLFGGMNLTNAGGVVGTAEYMSPEQADGRLVTNRCDQYSLGCVMYTLLAGRPPFRGNSMPEVLQLQRFAQPEPVRRFAPDTPDELERIILQLLAKDPEKRFPDARILSRNMEAMVKGLSRITSAPPSGDPAASESSGISEGQSRPGIHAAETRVSPSSAGVAPDELKLDELISPPAGSSSGDSPTTYKPSRLQASQAAAAKAPPPEPSTATHFTTVEEEVLQRRAETAESPATRWMQLAGLSVALAALIVAIWYMLQPATADQLYESVRAVAEREDVANWAQIAPAIDEFLRRFPDDPRTAEMRDYQDEIEIERLSRRLSSRSGRGRSPAEMAMIERRVLRAMQIERTDPALASEHLSALLTLFDDSTDQLSDADRRALELARRKRDQLAQQIAKTSAGDRQAIQVQLDRAGRLSATQPEQAEAIWRAIITLYGDQPWAQAEVDQARAALNPSP